MSQIETKTQVDRLGERLKQGEPSEAELRLLDQYRRSFSDAHEIVISTIRDRLGLKPTGRAAKSTSAIVDKLRRESIRLSQVQDIAGCRLIVSDILEQDHVVAQIRLLFPNARVMDRRAKASHGYRAVHVVVDSEGKLVEIQVRTLLQHGWAELSEKLSDTIDRDIKYGGGREPLRSSLLNASVVMAQAEVAGATLSVLMRRGGFEAAEEGIQERDLKEALSRYLEIRRTVVKGLADLAARVSRTFGVDDAIPD